MGSLQWAIVVQCCQTNPLFAMMPVWLTYVIRSGFEA